VKLLRLALAFTAGFVLLSAPLFAQEYVPAAQTQVAPNLSLVGAGRIVFPATVAAVTTGDKVVLDVGNGQIVRLDSAFVIPMDQAGHPLLLSSLAPGQRILVASPSFIGGFVQPGSNGQVVFFDQYDNITAIAPSTMEATAP
jgi:hypothetical protein